MPLMRSRILFHPVRSDEVNRFAYVPKDWADELSSQHRGCPPPGEGVWLFS